MSRLSVVKMLTHFLGRLVWGLTPVGRRPDGGIRDREHPQGRK